MYCYYYDAYPILGLGLVKKNEGRLPKYIKTLTIILQRRTPSQCFRICYRDCPLSPQFNNNHIFGKQGTESLTSVVTVSPPPPLQTWAKGRSLGAAQTQLRDGDAGENADDDQRRRDEDAPQLDTQDVLAVGGPGGSGDGGQQEQVDCVAGPAVVPPQRPGSGVAAEHGGHGPHEEAEEVLQQQQGARGDAEVGVRTVEVRGPVGALVGLDHGDARGEEQEGDEVEGRVGAGADQLALGGARRLEDQDGLRDGEDAEGLEERVRRDEREEGVEEDAGPDDG